MAKRGVLNLDGLEWPPEMQSSNSHLWTAHTQLIENMLCAGMNSQRAQVQSGACLQKNGSHACMDWTTMQGIACSALHAGCGWLLQTSLFPCRPHLASCRHHCRWPRCQAHLPHHAIVHPSTRIHAPTPSMHSDRFAMGSCCATCDRCMHSNELPEDARTGLMHSSVLQSCPQFGSTDSMSTAACRTCCTCWAAPVMLTRPTCGHRCS